MEKFESVNFFLYSNQKMAGLQFIRKARRIMGKEPLEEDQVSTSCRIKDSGSEYSVESKNKQHADENRCSQNHDHTGSILAPDKDREPEPIETGCPHLVNSDQYVDTHQQECP